MLSLMKQKHLSLRQWRLITYLSKFDINFKFIEEKKNIIADLLSRIAKRSTYKHDLSYLEESNAHLAAIQLRRDKTLLKKPAIKKRSFKQSLKLTPETLNTQNKIHIIEQRSLREMTIISKKTKDISQTSN